MVWIVLGIIAVIIIVLAVIIKKKREKEYQRMRAIRERQYAKEKAQYDASVSNTERRYQKDSLVQEISSKIFDKFSMSIDNVYRPVDKRYIHFSFSILVYFDAIYFSRKSFYSDNCDVKPYDSKYVFYGKGNDKYSNLYPYRPYSYTQLFMYHREHGECSPETITFVSQRINNLYSSCDRDALQNVITNLVVDKLKATYAKDSKSSLPAITCNAVDCQYGHYEKSVLDQKYYWHFDGPFKGTDRSKYTIYSHSINYTCESANYVPMRSL